MSSALAWGVLVHSNQSFDFQTKMNLTKKGQSESQVKLPASDVLRACNHHHHRPHTPTFFSSAAGLCLCSLQFDSIHSKPVAFLALFGRLIFWLISRLWLICCERKTLFHG
jgi:hypothetical protein